MKNFYITTPIYYPSAKLHIGHAYTTVAGDVIKRYKEKKGFNVFYLTGSDEHGQKIETVASENGVTPKVYVDGIVEDIKKLWDTLDIKYDKFIRTTDKEHEEIVQKIFTKLLENDDIYLDKYSGLYCKSDEAYYTKTQVSNGVCPDCGKKLEMIEEESYFFRCSKYVDKLSAYYEQNPDFLMPNHRLKELINNFIKPGLEDLAVSRTSFNWGIEVNENPKHVIYVWLDALTNYITALGYLSEDSSKMNEFWPVDIQLIGKEITRFHVIYWPMFLMALGLELPKQIFAHGWLLMDNDKMSKSKGNVIYPDFIVENYGADALRYYLLREVPFGSDGQFTPSSFVSRYNNDLTNDLSNLVNRTVAMINKYFDGDVKYTKYTNENYDSYNSMFLNEVSKFDENMEQLNFSKALTNLWGIISQTNKLIDLEEPWVLAKDVESNKDKLSKVLWQLCESIAKIANLVEPFIPNTANLMLNNLGIKYVKVVEGYENIWHEEYTVLEKPQIIYNRLNAEEEVEKILLQMTQDLGTETLK